MYGAWRMRQQKWDAVKKHAGNEMGIPVLRDTLEAAYVFSVVRSARSFEAGRHSDDWLWYCTLS